MKGILLLLVGGSTDDDLDDERVVGAASGGTGPPPSTLTTGSSSQPPATATGTARFPRRSILKSRRSEESLSPLSDPTAGGAGSGLVPGLSINSIFSVSFDQ